MRRRALVLSAGAFILLVVMATPASAHPLGNFTVNHYDGLTLRSHTILDMSIVDSAEIPTAQLIPKIDVNHDERVSAAEGRAYAGRTCLSLAAALQLSVGGRPATFVVTAKSFGLHAGVAGLRTSRLVCELAAPAELAASRSVMFSDTFENERVGWHEITAQGQGVHLVDSPVPTRSVSNRLLRYPNDLLSSPLNVSRAELAVRPGGGGSTVAPGASVVPRSGLSARAIDRVTATFNNVVGRKHLTVAVGLLAVGLALLLGASHALLPGHGKTVMAAYLAGRQGSVRDAFLVGATVTATHTAGVLLLGLALTLSASLAGDAVLGWLGVVSGGMVGALGAGLLVGALRERSQMRRSTAVGHTDNGHGHVHTHGHGHGHDHDHGADHGAGQTRAISRRGLIGMGVAGGLVPSPSALVVLLAAVALGRTIFGVALVICYGLGMAITLTAAGLLLVIVRDRYQARPRRVDSLGARWLRLMPVATASVVIVVGVALAARSLGAV